MLHSVRILTKNIILLIFSTKKLYFIKLANEQKNITANLFIYCSIYYVDIFFSLPISMVYRFPGNYLGTIPVALGIALNLIADKTLKE